MKKIIAVLTTVLAMSACSSITGPTPDDDEMLRAKNQLRAAAAARPSFIKATDAKPSFKAAAVRRPSFKLAGN